MNQKKKTDPLEAAVLRDLRAIRKIMKTVRKLEERVERNMMKILARPDGSGASRLSELQEKMDVLR